MKKNLKSDGDSTGEIEIADQFQPKPEHKFTFGLWTVGSVGRDPFGEPVREVEDLVEAIVFV